MKNKIGWCDMTWNPVWGCRNHCEYCYARGIARRFAGDIAEYEIDFIYGGSIDGNSLNAFYEEKKADIENFIPTFLHSQFDKKFPKKPQRIFVGSMSEIAHWEKEWVRDVLDKVLEYPQHTFIFLTKYPEVYENWYWHNNCWLGITITDTKNYNHLEYQKFKISNPNNLKFVSFEPLFNKISINLEGINWVIIGAETGNRKGKVIPNLDWVLNIVRYCEHNKIPVYIKDNLVKLYPQFGGIKQFPVIK